VRSRDWVKLPHRTLTTVVVVGWVRAESGGGVASLAVADPAGGFLGTVGSGMTDQMSTALLGVLAGISRAEPDPGVHIGVDARALLQRFGDRLTWVEPLLVAEVRHLGRTGSGSLRQPTLTRMRPDLGPASLPGSTW
jgi:bifunctional non-homologous end joining protein LigD